MGLFFFMKWNLQYILKILGSKIEFKVFMQQIC